MALVAMLALAAIAAATHVSPTALPGSTGNPTCLDYQPAGTNWQEFKIDPPNDGLYSDGNLTILIEFHDNSASEPKTFDWTATMGNVSAIVVKAGSNDKNGGHNLHEYDPAQTGDTGLTSPGEAHKNAISHVTFCYEVSQSPTCEENAAQDQCVETCEENPAQEQCVETCEANPEQEQCMALCEAQPDHPDCQDACPATAIMATANQDGSITVVINTTGAFELHRTDGDGTMLLGSFDGNTTYQDAGTALGVSYTYDVVVDTASCGQVDVTSIPVFPSMLASAAAFGIGVLGFLGSRRR